MLSIHLKHDYFLLTKYFPFFYIWIDWNLPPTESDTEKYMLNLCPFYAQEMVKDKNVQEFSFSKLIIYISTTLINTISQ